MGADVEVEPGAVGQEHVAAAPPRHDPPEQVPGDLVGAEAALTPQRAGGPVLVLQPEDPAVHGLQPTVTPLQPVGRASTTRSVGAQARHSCSRSEEHTSELQSLMRISYAVFCLKKK